jgi:hypothetical protein
LRATATCSRASRSRAESGVDEAGATAGRGELSTSSPIGNTDKTVTQKLGGSAACASSAAAGGSRNESAGESEVLQHSGSLEVTGASHLVALGRRLSRRRIQVEGYRLNMIG